jgi:RNA-binding protein
MSRPRFSGSSSSTPYATPATTRGAEPRASKKRSPLRPSKVNAARKVERDSRKAAAARATRTLTKADLQHLKRLAHDLSPVVHIGKEGVTETLVSAVAIQLGAHELIKLRVLTEAPEDRHATATAVAAAAGATLVQVLGRTLVLFRPNPRTPKVELPAA